jgi:hypothetical protein
MLKGVKKWNSEEFCSTSTFYNEVKKSPKGLALQSKSGPGGVLLHFYF